jgi:hypothetical protein
VIPPAFLKIIQNVSEGILDKLKRHRSEKYKFDVSTNQSFEKPAQEMS